MSDHVFRVVSCVMLMGVLGWTAPVMADGPDGARVPLGVGGGEFRALTQLGAEELPGESLERIIDPCRNNQPPESVYWYEQAQGDLSVTFHGEDAVDPEEEPLLYLWDWGDGSEPEFGTAVMAHEFAEAGDYAVYLTVFDACGAADLFGSTISVVDPGGPEPTVAAFDVYYLDAVDADGTEHWVEVDLENEQIELGMRLKFDASASTGAYFYVFSYGDNTYNQDMYSAVEMHQYAGAGPYSVNLTVYDQTGMQFDSVTRVVSFDEGMEWLSKTRRPGEDVWPKHVAVYGNNMWVVSGLNALAWADISDPTNLYDGGFELILPATSMQGVSCLAANAEWLYAARGADGVLLYDVSDFGAAPVVIPVEELGESLPRAVGASGHVLYVTTVDEVLHLFDCSGAVPVGLGSFVPDGGVQAMVVSPNGQRLLTISADGWLSVFDLSSPAQPVQLGDSIQLPPAQQPLGVYRLEAADTVAAVQTDEGTAVVWLDEFGFEAVPSVQLCPGIEDNFGVCEDRLYLVDAGTGAITRYDISDRFNPPYMMQMLDTTQCSMTEPFVHDPDGDGPLSAVLMVGHTSTGFSAYAR